MSGVSGASNRPRTRQRAYKPPSSLSVPDIDEDAAERKRVLNVLAQRRYRNQGQRKRQSRLHDNESEHAESKRLDEPAEDPTTVSPPRTAEDAQRQSQTAASTVSTTLSGLEDRTVVLDVTDLQWAGSTNPMLSQPLFADGEDFSSMLFDDMEFTLAPSAPNDFSSLAMDSPAYASRAGSSANSDWSGATSFPDSYLLPVNELTLLRAAMRVAGRLNAQSVWDLAANSPFNMGTCPPSDQIPPAWQPTSSQLIMPHHPVIDLLPWASCRDRILEVLSLPDDARPPAARGELALVNFVYDMEDSAEGIRIWGSDPYDDQSWEVGQFLFERWWFIFDRAVIERSNHWRRLRGAPHLRMGLTTSEGTIASRVTEE